MTPEYAKESRPPEPLRIFLDELPWDLRRHNTDGRYVRATLPRLADFQPGLRLIPQHSNVVALGGNAKILRAALLRRLGRPPSLEAELTSHLSARELAGSRAQVVFSHRGFPLNAGAVTVVWQQSILDPAMQRSYGASEAALAEEREVKGRLFRRAAFVQVSTEAEARRHALAFPDISERFVAVPFFSPHVEPCPPEALARHFDLGPVRLLFVGGQARRKGLDLLLEAFASLPAAVQTQARLTIVSNLDRSSIRIPDHEGISWIRDAGISRVMAEMRRAHVFINLARFESYGLVFHEAMSQGLAVVGPQWEVQRELLENGKAGLNLPCNAAVLQAALEELIVDPSYREKLGRRAWERFQEQYSPRVVAEKFFNLFSLAASHAYPEFPAQPSGAPAASGAPA